MRPLLAGGLAAAAAAGCGLTAAAITVRSLARGHCFSEAGVPGAPVGLVLGARVFLDGSPTPFLAARLELGHRLLAANRVQTLVLSGDASAPEGDEPAAMERYLRRAGVPADRLRLDPGGRDTYDSCWRLRRVYGVRAAVVVTQSYHLTRAVATARALGIDAAGVGDDTVRAHRRSWRAGAVREWFAGMKTLWDLGSGRVPRPPPIGPAASDGTRTGTATGTAPPGAGGGRTPRRRNRAVIQGVRSPNRSRVRDDG